MPQPLQVQPQSGSTAGTTVASIDAVGNEQLTGSLTVGGVLALAMQAAAPGQVPGQVQMYTADGTSVSYVGAGGQPVTQNANAIALTGTVTADTVLTAGITTDTVPRYSVQASGKMNWGPGGSSAQDTSIYRAAADTIEVNATVAAQFTGAVSMVTAGGGLQIKEGTDARMGTAVLVAGAATVANTSVTATTRVFLTSQADGGTPGWLRVSARTAGTSFTITSSSATDTSTVAYLLIEPA